MAAAAEGPVWARSLLNLCEIEDAKGAVLEPTLVAEAEGDSEIWPPISCPDSLPLVRSRPLDEDAVLGWTGGNEGLTRGKREPDAVTSFVTRLPPNIGWTCCRRASCCSIKSLFETEWLVPPLQDCCCCCCCCATVPSAGVVEGEEESIADSLFPTAETLCSKDTIPYANAPFFSMASAGEATSELLERRCLGADVKSSLGTILPADPLDCCKKGIM